MAEAGFWQQRVGFRLIGISFCLLLGLFSYAQAATINVPADFSTIQAGIDAALGGDLVLVSPGTYSETIDFLGKPITLQSADGPQTTIINAGGSGSVVTCSSGETAGTVIRGFTLTGGNAAKGGGLFCNSTSPTVSHCIFTGNSATDGGAVYSKGDNPTFINCLLYNNTASGSGGAIYNFNSDPTLTNCTLTLNIASDGAIYNNNGSTPTIINSILWGDIPSELAGAGVATISFSDVAGGPLNVDPMFVNGASDFRLQVGSALIGQGDNSALNMPSEDLDGRQRILGGVVELGVYEFFDDCNGNDIPDEFEFDSDGDGIPDNCDACPGFDDTLDNDSDDIPNDCDSCPNDPENDSDGDGVCGDVDICSGFNDNFDTDSDGIPDGCDIPTVLNLTKGTSFSTIQAAIDDVGTVNGDEIVVATGTWIITSSIDFKGKAITLRGGSGNPADTILDGQNSVYHIVQCLSGEGLDTALSSFTITGGRAMTNSSHFDRGGGMYIKDSSPTVSNCIFSRNTVFRNGGGVQSENSNSIITDCVFVRNSSSGAGGGMNISGGNPIIKNCIFDGNWSHKGGGMQSTPFSSVVMTNCIFSNNKATSNAFSRDGGGVYNSVSSSLVLNQCIFSGNSATGYGGGIFNLGGDLFITNGIFIENAATIDGGGLFNTANNPVVSNSIFWGNTSSGGTDLSGQIYTTETGDPLVTYSDIQGGWPGEGNINADPLFVDVVNGNLHFSSGSPCIDSGSNLAAVFLTADFDNTQRKANGIVDMGVYEFQDCDNDGTDNYLFDSDGDLVPDGCDLYPECDDLLDSDGDGIVECLDAPSVHNRTQGTSHFTIQDALDQAVNLDLIEVDPGTYTIRYSIDFLGKAVTLRSTSGDPNDTIVDGQYVAYHVFQCVNNEEPNTVLSGFTITGGNANGNPPDSYGAGMIVLDSSPTIEHCVFIDNYAIDGGGIIVSNSSSIVSDCKFFGNIASARGGGIICYARNENSLRVLNSQLVGNSANVGGGMYVQHTSSQSNLSEIMIANCYLKGNTASEGGGIYTHNYGLSKSYNNTFVTNCVFTENMADSGGGMYNDNGYFYPEISNCSFNGNIASGNGGGSYFTSGYPRLTNSIFWENSDSGGIGASGQIYVETGVTNTVIYCDVQGGWVGEGNIDAAPSFVDAANGDFHLQEGSPCIESGTNNAYHIELTDLDGLPRIQNGFIDMGAYEFVSDCDNNGIADYLEIDSDGDRVTDLCDLCPGYDDTLDSDGDGVANGCDVCPDTSDPNQQDDDGDGVGNDCELCPGFDDTLDNDGDTIPDDCDVCSGGNDRLDYDGDGVPNDCDICPGDDDMVDSDADGVPDGCDLCPGFDDVLDGDVDSVPDGCDVCPGGNDTIDGDGDGVPDDCDLCPGNDDSIDSDADGIPNGCDGCPFDSENDADGDGVCGNVDKCPGFDDNLNSDGDTLPDDCDNCPNNQNNNQSDLDDDGIGDVCDCAEAYSGGNGTKNDPYLIGTTGDLSHLGLTPCHWDKHFRLTTDLNLVGVTMSPIGTIDLPFGGTFDGAGYAIANLGINLSSLDCVGLFGHVDNTSDTKTIFNLRLTTPTILGKFSVGGLVGCLVNGTVENCFVENGIINGFSEIGGLVGVQGVLILDGDYIAKSGIGMLSDCYATGVVGDVSAFGNVGGLVGFIWYENVITSCLANVNVTGGQQVGGFVGGNNGGTINSCYATGMVSGNNFVGGFVGALWGGGAISTSFATGAVSGDMNVGGLAGGSFGGVYVKSFWDNMINPDLNGIGDGSDPNVIGESTSNLQIQGTFTNVGWDFGDVWRMCLDGVSYPRLRWEYDGIGDWECPDGVFVEDLRVLADEWLMRHLVYDVAGGRDGVVDWFDFVEAQNSAWVTGPPYDLAGFAGEWLGVGAVRDDVFDLYDFSAMAANWMAGI